MSLFNMSAVRQADAVVDALRKGGFPVPENATDLAPILRETAKVMTAVKRIGQ